MRLLQALYWETSSRSPVWKNPNRPRPQRGRAKKQAPGWSTSRTGCTRKRHPKPGEKRDEFRRRYYHIYDRRCGPDRRRFQELLDQWKDYWRRHRIEEPPETK